MPKSFHVLRGDRAAMENLQPGAIVYECMEHDYGIARDDSNMTGVQHVSVTLNESGAGPFFTIPEMDLAEVRR